MKENVMSPASGHAVNLTLVPDEMFANKMLGDGIAIKSDCEAWVSPVEGTITLIYSTKHAIGITSKLGTELLIHIGLDTYELGGIPFEMLVKVHDTVRVGDPLVHVNLDYIREHGYNLITPIISTNKEIEMMTTNEYVNAGDTLFQIKE